MGLYSYECLGCGHPMLSGYSTGPINEWMQNVVIIHPRLGVVAAGHYDGYGRTPKVDDVEAARKGGDPMYVLGWDKKTQRGTDACWHRSCWEVAGRPGFDRPSSRAADQGYFFDDGDHALADPYPELYADE